MPVGSATHSSLALGTRTTTAMENRNSIDKGYGSFFYRDIVVADGRVGFDVSCPPEGSMDLELTTPLSGDRVPLHLHLSDRTQGIVAPARDHRESVRGCRWP
jgi:hypothetical protein